MEGAIDTAVKQVLKEELGVNDPWKFPPQDVLEFITGREQSVQDCGKTVRGQLNTALGEGIELGETTDELASRVRGVFNDLSKGEAKRIATTETAMSFNFARDSTMKAAGIEYKAWLTSKGPNVREAHQQAEDEYGEHGTTGPIPVDEPFIVDGEPLMYPGDPHGRPGNVINCQCIQLAVRTPKEATL